MPGSELTMGNHNNSLADSTFDAYLLLTLITGFVGAVCVFARYVESQNHFNYDSRLARILGGFFLLMVKLLHTKSVDDPLISTEGKLITAGPHKTGWDAIAFATRYQGDPIRIFATDAYNGVPLIAKLMNIFKVIPVAAHPLKNADGSSSNTSTIDLASKVLQEKGCVSLFPQGNFALIGQKPHMIYPGAARLAISNKVPIDVIRLDGFWSLQDPLIPLFIRNNLYYRAFLSILHLNNVQVTLCCTIDFHLKSENEHLTYEEQEAEINAQLYAFYRHTEDLTPNQINSIKMEIASGNHKNIWKARHEQYKTEKEIRGLEQKLTFFKQEEARLEEPTRVSMKL